jgi:hypothetical protein
VDCAQELPDGMRFIEIKSSETLSPDHIKNIVSLRNLFKQTEDYVVYAGQNVSDFHNVRFVNWKETGGVLKAEI